MTAVSAKALKSFGFADVSKQIFVNPYTKKSPATLSPAGGFISLAVTYVCHNSDKNGLSYSNAVILQL